MGLDLAALGRTAGPFEASWTETDTLLYALGVGAGQADASGELDLTTENSDGHPQTVLPTFAVAFALRDSRLRIDYGDVDRSKLVHAEQSLELHGRLQPAGAVRLSSRIAEIADKGSGALIVTEYTGSDAGTGEPLFTSRLTAFLKGAGGFGTPSTASRWVQPDRQPDLVVAAPTRPDQALLYRLSGDRNRLHTDPVFARQAGFERPILHGLCTYGITARLLLAETGKSADALRFISGRFTKPVYPGEKLTIQAWIGDDEYLYRTVDSSGAVVLDRGVVRAA